MNETIKQRNGSAKILIAILIVLILIAAGVGIFILPKYVNFNFTSKSKFVGAFTDVGEKISNSSKSFSTFSENSLKAYNKLENKPIEYSMEVSADINELTIPGLSTTQAKSIKGMINENTATLNLKADFDEDKFYGDLMLNDEKLGEIVYNSNAMALKVPELEKNNIAIFRNTLRGTEYEDLEKVFDFLDEMQFNYSSVEDMSFTAEEIKHFLDTYSKIFENYVTDDMLETEKTDITIDGNKKSCNAITLKLNGKQLASLLEKYIDTFEEDNEGIEILIDKYIKLSKSSYMYEMMLEERGYTEKELKANMKDEIKDFTAELKDSLKNIRDNDDTTYKFIAYSDMFKTYRLDIIAETDDEEMKLTMNIKDDGIYSTLTVNDDLEKFNMNLNILKGGIEINTNIDNITVFEFNLYAHDENDFELLMKNEMSEYGKFKVTVNSKTESKSDTEIVGDMSMALELELMGVELDGKLNMKQTTKSANKINIPEITTSNSIDAVETGLLDELTEQLLKTFGMNSNNNYNSSNNYFNNSDNYYNNYNTNTNSSNNSYNTNTNSSNNYNTNTNSSNNSYNTNTNSSNNNYYNSYNTNTNSSDNNYYNSYNTNTNSSSNNYDNNQTLTELEELNRMVDEMINSGTH